LLCNSSHLLSVLTQWILHVTGTNRVAKTLDEPCMPRISWDILPFTALGNL